MVKPPPAPTLMIFDLLVPPQGPRGVQPPPPPYPQVLHLGYDPGDRMKFPSDMFYIFHL